MIKNRLYSLLACLLLIVPSIQAQERNILYIPDTDAEVGKEFQIPVFLQNTSTNITAIQFDLQLPDDVLLVTSNISCTWRTTNHQVRYEKKSKNLWTFMLYSNNNATIMENEGEIIKITAKVNEGVTTGSSFQMNMSKVAISDNQGKNVLTSYSCGNINLIKAPDFTVTDVACSHSTIRPEDKISATWKVKNIGNKASTGGWSENIFLITDDDDRHYLGSQKYDGTLNADEEVTRSFNHEFDRFIGFGGSATLFVELTPDDNSGEPEFNYWNNNGEGEKNAITVVRILYVTLPSKIMEPGKDSTIVMKIERSGSISPKQSVYLKKTGDERLIIQESVDIPELTRNVSIDLTIKDDNIVNKEQSFIIEIESPGYETVTKELIIEDDEKTPDFAVTDVTSSHSTIEPEDQITISWKVKNIGKLASSGGWTEHVSLFSETGETKELESLKYDNILEAESEIARSLDYKFESLIGLDGKATVVVELTPDDNSGELDFKSDNNKNESDKITIKNKLYVTLTSQIIEPAQDSLIVMKVVRTGSTKSELEISIDKIGDERLVLPEKMIIPAYYSEATFKLTIKSDYIVNENQSFSLEIKAEGYETATKTLVVIDDDAIFPNLHILGIECSEPTAGKMAEISWVVKNDGFVGTGETEWIDYVWLLPEVKGGTSMSGAERLGSYPNLSALEPGESYENKVSIKMPDKVYGNYDLVVMSDMEELNNIDFNATGGVTPYPYEPATSDYGYLKGKTSYNPVKLREAGEVNRISDNFFYKRINIKVPPIGDVAVTKVVAIVDTSDDGKPSPLSMAGLARTAAFYSGKRVTLTVTVTNEGGTDIENTEIANNIYISHNEDKDEGTLQLLKTQHCKLALAKGESKTITLNCLIPYEWSGDSWFHVQINSDEAIDELASNQNNWGHSDMSYILLTPGADFIIRDFKTPSSITAGLPFNISYTVKNIGPGVPYVNTWTDKVYISKNPNGVDDSAVLMGTYTQEGTYKIDKNGQIVYSGDDYSVIRTITAPNIKTGDYYIYLVIDAKEVVFEFEGEDNNIAISSSINCITPELTAELVSISEEILIKEGTSIFTWKLNNIGEGDIKDTEITNTFYASSSENGNNPIMLMKDITNISIASGEELMMDAIINIPNRYDLDGNMFVFMVTNENKTVAEDNHNNNKSNALSKIFEPASNLTITNISCPDTLEKGKIATIKLSLKNKSNFPINGNATAKVTLTPPRSNNATTLEVTNPVLLVDGMEVGSTKDVEISIIAPDNIKGGEKYLNAIVEPENSGASSKHKSVFLNGNLPKLTVSNYNVPDTIETAKSTDISLTISNIGEWDSNRNSFTIWLMNSMDDNNPILIKRGSLAKIAKGEKLDFNTAITIEDKNYGEKYLRIKINSDDYLYNFINCYVYIPIVIEQALLPDLVISDISVEGSLRNGEKAIITAKVTNKGLGKTRRNRWNDAFYLYTGNNLNFVKAIKLSERIHNGALSPEESYDIKIAVNIPVDSHGNYYLYGITDINNTIYEGDNNNNIDMIKVYVEDKTDRPSQLTVSSLSVPSTIRAGEEVKLSYNVSNSGQFTAEGTLRDIIYLSEDSKWDKNDIMVGSVSGNIGIDPNSNTTREIRGRILNVKEGSYYLIVKTNTTRNIIETDYTDNIAVSSHPVNISFTNLSLGGMTSVQTSGYYKLEVSGTNQDKTLGFYINHNEEEPCGLYVSYESVPSTAKYEWSSATIQTNEQEVLVPRAKSGTYYILAQANSAANLNVNQFVISGESQELPNVGMTLSVKDIPFGATNLSVKEGGTEGWLSTIIRGAMLDSIMDFRLAKDNHEIPLEALTFHNQTQTVATFNLHRAETGTYDVISELPDGTQARLSNGFKVVPGKSVKLGIKMNLPPAVSSYVIAPISIAYANAGNTDDAIKEILVEADRGDLSFTIQGIKEQKRELRIVPDMGQDKRGFISIPPGTHEVINCFIGTSGDCTVTVYVVK